jgi:hypothetical protein
MPKRILATSVTCIALAALLGCSQPTRVTSTWAEQEPPDSRTFEKILVVGVTTNANRRRSFEDAVVDHLKARGNNAWASSRVMDVSATLDRESIGQAAESVGADALIATRLISRKVVAEEVDSRTGVKTQRKTGNVVDFFRYDYNEYEEPAYVIPKNTVVLSTDLYETRQGTLIYSLETTTYDKETIYDIIEEVSAAITSRLSRDKLVR